MHIAIDEKCIVTLIDNFTEWDEEDKFAYKVLEPSLQRIQIFKGKLINESNIYDLMNCVEEVKKVI